MSAKREDLDDDEIWFLYNIEKWTLQKIADYLGVALTTIYNRLHPEKNRENNKKWRDLHPEKQKERYEKRKDYLKEYWKKYRQTEKGIARDKRYWQSQKGKINMSKHSVKRRELGFIPVNSFFIGGIWHHIDLDHVICIPEEVHKSIPHNVWTDEGMEEINEVAFEYITEEEFERLVSGELDRIAVENGNGKNKKGGEKERK